MFSQESRATSAADLADSESLGESQLAVVYFTTFSSSEIFIYIEYDEFVFAENVNLNPIPT